MSMFLKCMFATLFLVTVRDLNLLLPSQRDPDSKEYGVEGLLQGVLERGGYPHNNSLNPYHRNLGN